jgi:hypothetical protein
MRRATAGIAFAFCLAACVFLAACAAPGDPTTRHPIVPVRVTDLAAQQSGTAVILTFSLPRQSTDRESLAEPPAIEIYRAALPAGAKPDRKTAWRLVYTIPSERVDSYVKEGRVEFRDPLTPDDLARAPGSDLTYMVRTRAVKVRASEDSNDSTINIHPPPNAPSDLQVSVTESAIALAWKDSLEPNAISTALGFRVYREELEPPSTESKNVTDLRIKSPFELLGQTSATEFRDEHFEFGHTYEYSVRRFIQYGADLVESNESPGSTVSVTPKDIFPPAAPLGLEATVISATSPTPAYVELSWAIGPEADLAGYYVYRSDREDTPGERISGEILPSPTFRDISVVAGKRYYYRVSAVDRAGNESSKSSAVQIEVP